MVLSEQPVVAALVGILVEQSGRPAVFAEADEQPAAAVRRLRPVAVIVIDAEIPAAASDLLFALASRAKVGVVVFGSEGQARRVAEIAARRAIPWVILPDDADRLTGAIDAAIDPATRSRSSDRRQPAEASVAPDGTHILRDIAGRRWMVYDRRGTSDRREAGANGPDGADRVFVAENGETRHCAVSRVELADRSASALEAQLDRAVR